MAQTTPPARLTVPATLTELRQQGGGTLNTRDYDVWVVKSNSPMINSLRFLSWEKSTNADEFVVPILEVVGVVLAVITFPSSLTPDLRAALVAANLIEHRLSIGCCSDILFEMHTAGVFDKVYMTEAAFVTSIDTNTLIDPTVTSMQSSWIVKTEDFAGLSPAAATGRVTRANPAPAAGVGEEAAADGHGPPALLFLQQTSWYSMVREGELAVAGKGQLLLARMLVLLLSGRRRKDLPPEQRQHLLGTC